MLGDRQATASLFLKNLPYLKDLLVTLYRVRRHAHTFREGCVFDTTELPAPFFCHYSVREGRFGKGMFATRDIAEGEAVFLLPLGLTRRIASMALRLEDGIPHTVDPQVHCVPFTDAYYFIPYLAFMNHRCSPSSNCRMRIGPLLPELGRVAFAHLATQEIRKDDELTIDYGTFEYEIDSESAFVCRCGAPGCVGAYRGFQGYEEGRQLALIDRDELAVTALAEYYGHLSPEQRARFRESTLARFSDEEKILFYFCLIGA